MSTGPEGIRYIVEHGRTGLLSQPRDWRGLGENVVRVLRDPALAATLARNAYEQSRLYRWETVRSQWLRLYRSALAGSAVAESSTNAAVPQKSLTAEVK